MTDGSRRRSAEPSVSSSMPTAARHRAGRDLLRAPGSGRSSAGGVTYSLLRAGAEARRVPAEVCRARHPARAPCGSGRRVRRRAGRRPRPLLALSSVLLGAGASATRPYRRGQSRTTTRVLRSRSSAPAITAALHLRGLQRRRRRRGAPGRLARRETALHGSAPFAAATADGGPLRARRSVPLRPELTPGDYVLQIDAQTGPAEEDVPRDDAAWIFT